VATQQISTHWLRHTTLTWVERSFGYAVARAYAGHTDVNGHAGTTATYVRADLPEIAAALAELTGEPHPLVRMVAGPEATSPERSNRCRSAQHNDVGTRPTSSATGVPYKQKQMPDEN
jgi:hypothetical protein